MLVRIASPEDRDSLYELLINHCNDVNEWLTEVGLPISLGKLHKFVTAGCNRDGGVIGVIDLDGKLIASVGLFASQPWWTDEWCISQHWLYVFPSMRGAGLEPALFQFAEDHKRAIEQKAGKRLPLDISVISRDRLSAKIRLWKKYATMIGGLFLVP